MVYSVYMKKNSSRILMATIVSVIIILAIFYGSSSKHKEPDTELVPAGVIQGVSSLDACPTDISIVKVETIEIVSGVPVAAVYYEKAPSEYNNFTFDTSKECSLVVVEIHVFGPRGGDDENLYSFASFRPSNTWENYLSIRSQNQDYITNVFRAQKLSDGYKLTEQYQE